jgi:hypothetical protein
MHPAALAATALTLLAPLLAKAGEKAAEKIGASLPDAAGALWTKIQARFAGNPAAETALKDAAANPQDEDNIASLRKELKKTLAEDAQFAKELESLLVKAQGELQAIRGDHNIAANISVQGDVSGNIVVGNNNQVSSGK